MSSFLIKLISNNVVSDKDSENQFFKHAELLSEKTTDEIKKIQKEKILIAYCGNHGFIFENDNLIIVCDGNLLVDGGLGSDDVINYICENWKNKKHSIIENLTGSFALFIYDKNDSNAYLYRDKFGVRSAISKREENSIFIASNYKLILPFVDQYEINDIALKEAMLFRWNAFDTHLLESFKQVPPSTYLIINQNLSITNQEYWSFKFKPETANNNIENYVTELDIAIKDFFEAYNLKDKTIGVFLSGGVDSSILAAIAKSECKKCIGFIGEIESDDEEKRRALIIAEKLGIECHVVPIDKTRFEDDLIKITGDIGTLTRHQNNLILLQIIEYASNHVDTILQGDAAEMLFGLSDSKKIKNFLKKRTIIERFIPGFLQSLLSRLALFSNHDVGLRLSRLLSSTLSTFCMHLDDIEYLPKNKKIVDKYTNGIDEYLSSNNIFAVNTNIDDALAFYQLKTFLQASLLRFNTLSQPYNVNILAPFLHDKVVDVSISLPREYRYTFDSKPVARLLCDQYFSSDVSRWSKLGFPVPWGNWLNNELKKLCEESLNSNEIETLLPKQFIKSVEKNNDPEGLWSISSLKIIVDQYKKHRSH